MRFYADLPIAETPASVERARVLELRRAAKPMARSFVFPDPPLARTEPHADDLAECFVRAAATWARWRAR